MLERMDSIVGQTTPLDWNEGAWRNMLPGEYIPSEHQRKDRRTGAVIVPVRLYGTGETTGPMTQPAEQPQPPRLTKLRLSKGAFNLVARAEELGLDPVPFVNQARKLHPNGKVCVKGPLVDLRAVVNTVQATRG